MNVNSRAAVMKSETERENVRMHEKNEESLGQGEKAEGPKTLTAIMDMGQKGLMWRVVKDDDNKLSKEGETATEEYVRSPFRFRNRPTSACTPMTAGNPQCPPSAPSKRITSNVHMVRIGKRSRIPEMQVWIKSL